MKIPVPATVPAIAAFTAVILGGSVRADEALDANWARWKAAKITDYEYRYQKVCHCHPDKPADTIVIVDGGEIVAVSYDRDDYLNAIPVPAEKYDWFRTVDDLFVLITGAMDRQADVRVGYEPELGYPTRIYIDYVRDLVGDEVELQVVELQRRSD